MNALGVPSHQQFVGRLILSTLLITFLAACASTTASKKRASANGNGSSSDPWEVSVHFDATDNCKIDYVLEDPCASGGSTLCVERNQWVQWESEPSGIRFQVWFDPIQGAPINAPTGKVKKKIDPNAPSATYYYAILPTGAGCTTKDVFDPHIRVDD
jgi:hypothetical protein